jgi:hypothetical protein
MNYFNLLLMELLRSQKNNIGIGLTLNFTKKKKDLILFFVGILFFQGPLIFYFFFMLQHYIDLKLTFIIYFYIDLKLTFIIYFKLLFIWLT